MTDCREVTLLRVGTLLNLPSTKAFQISLLDALLRAITTLGSSGSGRLG